MAMIKLDQVSKYYKSDETVSVGMKNISLEFELGEFVAVTGESGSGKSTLLNVISGLDGYEDGELYLFGEETSHYTIADWERYRGTYIGFVFQNYNIIDSYTVYQNVLLALEIQGYDKKKRKQRALDLIEEVGLTSHRNHKASKLSGGQKQRAVIARALAKDCPIIVADEPTGNLDSASAKQVIDLLDGISKDKLVIVVTHDYDQVKDFATRKIKMHDGEVVEDRTIKKAEIVQLKELDQPKKMSFLELLRFATRNLLATPKKLLFLMIMQILVISVFTIVYTNQVSSIREVGLEQSSVYPSVPETRLLVEKRDGTSFTPTELEQFKNHRRVDAVHEHAMNFYNELYLTISKEDEYYSRSYLEGTDSAAVLKNRDISGRLPSALNEVVVSNKNRFEIGDTIHLDVGSSYFWDDEMSPDTTRLGTFIVVGIDKQDRGVLYFSETFLNQPPSGNSLIDYQALGKIKRELAYNMSFVYSGDKFYVNGDYFDQFPGDIVLYGMGEETKLVNKTVVFHFSYGFPFQEMQLTVNNLTISMPEDSFGDAGVSKNLYTQVSNYFLEELKDMYTISPKNYISLSVSGYYVGNKLLHSIDSDVYKVYYPANIASDMRDIQVFFLTFLAVILLTLFGLFLYSIVHAVTKNVMSARKKDFAIFRSIGTNQTTLAKLVVLEQVLMSIVGFIITLILINVLSGSIYSIQSALKYMELKDYLILLVAFMFFGAWLGLRFNKRIFKQSVIETLSQSRSE